jgi:hypothetical protein
MQLDLIKFLSNSSSFFASDFITKIFPSAWKFSKIVPVVKIKDPCGHKDYRPISILPARSKALENILKGQFQTNIDEFHAQFWSVITARRHEFHLFLAVFLKKN